MKHELFVHLLELFMLGLLVGYIILGDRKRK